MADRIPIKCDKCGKQFRAPAELAGKKTRCPCGNILAVPALETAEDLARKWYYAKEGQRYGPVPAGELKKLLESGQLSPGDHVWTAGMASWQKIEEVEALGAGAPPPLAPEKETVPGPRPPVEEALPVAAAVQEAPAPGPEAAAAAGKVAEKVEKPEEKPARAEEATVAQAAAKVIAAVELPSRYAALRIMRGVVGAAGLLVISVGVVIMVAAVLLHRSTESPATTLFLGVAAGALLIASGLVVLSLGEVIRLALDARSDLWHIRRRMEQEEQTQRQD